MHTQTLLSNRLWMFGRASCVSFKLGVGCIQVSDRVHGVYTYGHKQNLERKPWSARCAWPFDPGAESVCINKTEHLATKLNNTNINPDSTRNCLWSWIHLENVIENFFLFIYGRKYKLAKSPLRRCADKYVNTCVQVFDVEQTREFKSRNHFHRQNSEDSSAH